jgi:hypothetical protein
VGWAGWLFAVFSLWLQWQSNVYQPRTWLWLPFAVVGGIASGAVALGGLYGIARGPRRLAALALVIGGGTPMVLWTLLVVYMLYMPWRGGMPFNTIQNVGSLAAADLMTLHAGLRYAHRRESNRLVMYYGDPVDRPDEDLVAMDAHLARLETVLGQQQHSKIVWVRGSALGRNREANRGVAIGSPASPAGALDRHELAHAFIYQFTRPDTDPPTVLIEGWAVAQQGGDGRGLGAAAAAARAEIISVKKADRCLHDLTISPWYYQPVNGAYNIGGAWVDQLLRRYGGQRFLELYNSARPESFAADCQRILGRSLDDLQQDLWDEVYPFHGDVEAIKRAVRDDLPLGTKRERVEAWPTEHLGRLAMVTDQVKSVGFAGKSIAQLADCPETKVAMVVQFTVPLHPSDFQGVIAPNHILVTVLLDAAGEVTGYYFLTLREMAEIEARRAGR